MPAYHLEMLRPTFGARISGLDLRNPIDEKTAIDLVSALTRYRVLLVPEQEFGHADHIRVSRIFGPLDIYPVQRYIVPEFPEVLKISNIFENGVPIGLYDGDDQEEWHTDYSWKEVMSSASLLYSAVAPREGGDTLFADSTAAYDELSDSLKRRLQDLRAVHSMSYLVSAERKTNPHKAPLTEEELQKMPDVEHPLVQLHPVTGRRSLLLGSMIISGIAGLGESAGRALLDELHAHATAGRYVYRHHWSVGDLVIWDNRATMHTRTPCDHQVHQRLLYRTTVL
jgi:taurine dioxygenase